MPLPARPAGSQRVTLRASCGPVGDPVPENDRASARVRVGDPLVAVLVAPPEARAVLGALEFPGLQLVEASAASAEAELAGADLLWTVDVAAAELPAAAVERFVRAGGGWLACAGWRFLAGWGPGASGPAGMLPLVPVDDDLPERDVVLLVDGSGSMSGEPFERVRAATLELVLAGSPRDHFRLHFFTGTLGREVFDASGKTVDERRRELAPLLEASVPRGPTDVLFALRGLVRLRQGSSRPGLAFLMSDGLTVSWNHELSRSARAALAETDTDLRVLAIGDQADIGFLESLLQEGEELIEGGDLSNLARLLQREVNANRTRDGAGRPAVLRDAQQLAPGSTAREVVRAQAQGAPDGLLGPLARFVAAQLAPGAERLWSAPQGEPLLALQRVGEGWVAACASAPIPGWGHLPGARPGPLGSAAAGARAGGGSARARGPGLSIEGGRARARARAARLASPARGPRPRARAPPSLAAPRPDRELGRTLLAVPSGGADPALTGRRIGPRPEAPRAAGGWRAPACRAGRPGGGPGRPATGPGGAGRAGPGGAPGRADRGGRGRRAGRGALGPLRAPAGPRAARRGIGTADPLGPGSGAGASRNPPVRPKVAAWALPVPLSPEERFHVHLPPPRPDPDRSPARLLRLDRGLGLERAVRHGVAAPRPPTCRSRINRHAEKVAWTNVFEEQIELIQWFTATGEPAYPTLLHMAKDPRPLVAGTALAALGATRDARLVDHVRDLPYPSGDEPDMAYERARCLMMLGDWSELPVLIDGLRDERAYTRAVCARSLREATREDFGFDAKAEEAEREEAIAKWEEWWTTRSSDPLLPQ